MTFSTEPTFELSSDDRIIVDALMENGFEPDRLNAISPAQPRRADALLNLLRTLDDYPVEDAEDTLVFATLARIDRAEAEREARLRFDDAHEGERPGWRDWVRLPDFISVAAVLLIAASIIWPVMSYMRNQAIDAGCASNMRLVGNAFSDYASDYNAAMPVSFAGFGAGWDKVYNVANLDPLVGGGYCQAGHLNCPGNHDHTRPSLSYQLSVGEAMSWGRGRLLVVLGDRNPIIDAFRAGSSAPALSLSLNHSQRGQNVLQDDGSVLWLELPQVGDDNIWLPMGAERLQRGARPASASDIFLTH